MAMPFEPMIDEASMTDEHRRLLLPLLERLGRDELSAAYLWAAGVRLAPALDEKLLLAAHVAEELRHFERTAALHERLGGVDLLSRVGCPVQPRPPACWLELAVALFAFDRACGYRLRDYRQSRFSPLANLAAANLMDEERHDRAGQVILRDACNGSAKARRHAQAHLSRWLRLAIGSLCPKDRHDARAVTLGLCPRPSRDLARAYLTDVRAAAKTCGLTVPARLPRTRP